MTAVVAREDEFLNGLSFQELNVVHVDLDQGNKLLLRCFFLLYYCWKMNDFPFNVSLFFSSRSFLSVLFSFPSTFFVSSNFWLCLINLENSFSNPAKKREGQSV